MKKIMNNQKGSVLVIFAVTIFVLLGFVALALEAGRWYLTRAELSKGADAAALVAMQYNGVYDDAKLAALADEFGQANFKKGYLGTPEAGAESAVFSFLRLDESKIRVTGNVTSPAYISMLFGMPSVAFSTATEAKKKSGDHAGSRPFRFHVRFKDQRFENGGKNLRRFVQRVRG